ncbi:uncharacterized protein BYT42DRAFT_580674 [Radiomyces spectabilis]|uniref:uncharacterized protein n=1 Tax=Radiomyces spectabilis TaxID=64574 RepID=UPI00221F2065|nr:uncharacterized protein BYT42DRAFT_580674 [Radiomyces spectabilis]KAI8371553.1 hypothetical protein BYT42DRAFT_580674 [Radiomyces spectabilis]
MQDNKWPSSLTESECAMQSSYSYHSDYTAHSTAANSPAPSSQVPLAMPGLMSLSQPGTPRPERLAPASSADKLAESSPDFARQRHSLPPRASSFTTTTFQSNPYPGPGTIRRRRTESTMFSFEAGPSFSPTKQLLEVWADQSNKYQFQIHVKMDRGFFRADQDWTCYRRNYFQVSAAFDIHGSNYPLQGPEVPCLVRTEDQGIRQVDFFSIGVMARVAGSDKKIDLVQHTPKRDKGPQMVPMPCAVRPGGNPHLASVGPHQNIVTFERMQFKTATANNGKRRAAQQYYEVAIDLFAYTATGEQLRVATCTSAPLVVRGRSPGHYADSHTHYRNMDTALPTPPVGVGLPPFVSPPTPMSADDRERFMSLPASPAGTFGPYPPYHGYPSYALTSNYPMMSGPRPDEPSPAELRGPHDNDGYMMHPYPSTHPIPSPSLVQSHGMSPYYPPSSSSSQQALEQGGRLDMGPRPVYYQQPPRSEPYQGERTSIPNTTATTPTATAPSMYDYPPSDPLKPKHGDGENERQQQQQQQQQQQEQQQQPPLQWANGRSPQLTPQDPSMRYPDVSYPSPYGRSYADNYETPSVDAGRSMTFDRRYVPGATPTTSSLTGDRDHDVDRNMMAMPFMPKPN